MLAVLELGDIDTVPIVFWDLAPFNLQLNTVALLANIERPLASLWEVRQDSKFDVLKTTVQEKIRKGDQVLVFSTRSNLSKIWHACSSDSCQQIVQMQGTTQFLV